MKFLLAILILVAIAACKIDKSPAPTAGSARSAKIPAKIVRNAKLADPGEYPNPHYLPLIAGAMSENEYVENPDLNAEIQGQLGAPELNTRLRQCKAHLVARRGPVTEELRWILGLRFVGDGRAMSVTEVQAVDEKWPAFFDDEAKACWMEALGEISFESPRNFDRLIEMTFCVGTAVPDPIVDAPSE